VLSHVEEDKAYLNSICFSDETMSHVRMCVWWEEGCAHATENLWWLVQTSCYDGGCCFTSHSCRISCLVRWCTTTSLFLSCLCHFVWGVSWLLDRKMGSSVLPPCSPNLTPLNFGGGIIIHCLLRKMQNMDELCESTVGVAECVTNEMFINTWKKNWTLPWGLLYHQWCPYCNLLS
jgi:hypothetical protein